MAKYDGNEVVNMQSNHDYNVDFTKHGVIFIIQNFCTNFNGNHDWKQEMSFDSWKNFYKDG